MADNEIEKRLWDAAEERRMGGLPSNAMPRATARRVAPRRQLYC